MNKNTNHTLELRLRAAVESAPTTAVARFLDETLAQLEANPPGYPIGS